MGNNTNESDVIEIDLLELIGLLLHRWWIIVICGLLCGIAGFLISTFVITDQYESTTTVYILNKREDSTITSADITLGTQLTKDYAGIIKSRANLEHVIEMFGLDITYGTLNDRVSVTTQTDTRIVSISVQDEDPNMAKLLADEIRNVASERIKEIMDVEAVNLIDEAYVPLSPSSPNVMLWTLAGGMIGAVLSIGVILVGYLQDDSIKVSEDVERYLGLSTLGMIPITEEKEEHKNTKKSSSHSGRTHKSKGNSVDVVNLNESQQRSQPAQEASKAPTGSTTDKA